MKKRLYIQNRFLGVNHVRKDVFNENGYKFNCSDHFQNDLNYLMRNIPLRLLDPLRDRDRDRDRDRETEREREPDGEREPGK